ncbi:hypothetical protein HKBW3S03_00716 [Candidatus Hakubella thermalkaliphila]|uniref:Uncharacterized protein n=1 Tax=Candidatus Hakubella thermalkaliphila TaxID=2754717 RepID=A0A6V8PVI8_9ACTN|nr:hypothetical protein [Candidatus Hakubella thermalkaliphila]MBT9171248.1 hypothetical protein [Actinomycetota bacterium]GFP19211.1 hypothetical protein HKBW3S03_00716 [Candidatus Hakubella thermalkaliphila]GFP30498.1 hypothetical protein HKBW3S34_01418 [Candidatus Hakubella thermalkaliphila]GFP36535.1 hypothetical protein HKBW3S44_00218 [Candidatus Hakubella thermalkaliphila]GFP39831.1 hypothetical protein HKBW3S47_01528 [Candidatus Hakubella thermalkaliphila]
MSGNSERLRRYGRYMAGIATEIGMAAFIILVALVIIFVATGISR